MKTLIMIVVIIVGATTSSYSADTIPGYLTIKGSLSNFQSSLLSDREDIYRSYLGFEYGVFKGSYISPFIFGSMDNKFRLGGNTVNIPLTNNYPFHETYQFGFGIRIMNFFYIKYTHSCEHYVRSKANEAHESKYVGGIMTVSTKYPDLLTYPLETSDRFEIGFETTID